MSQPQLFVVRRCDNFYRFWHDVSDPAPLRDAHAAYDALTGGGTRGTTPADPEYYDIFAADPLPNWQDSPEPLIRRLHRHDAPAIKAHLLALNTEDRGLRFFRASTDAQIRDYVARIDWGSSLLVGAIQSDRIVGIAEALFGRPTTHRASNDHAEIAVSIDLPLRRKGLGRHLVRQALAYAEMLGARQTSLTFLRENRPIQRIIRALGGSVDMEDLVGVIHAAQRLAA
jgi:GNAT superfamily N-acetyltransferase